jgi:putative membrane protein
MKKLIIAGLGLAPLALRAADAASTSTGWHAQTLPQAIGYMVLFSIIGILLAIAGYWIFDKCTPGDLTKEILENKNVAAAIIGGAVIVGVCLIVAAAMLG